MEQSLRSIKQKAVPDLIELFVSFGALRTSEPPLAGGFELPTRDSLFPGAEDAIFHTWATTPKWKGSTVVYRAPNGDRLLIHPSGRTAWAQLERGEIVPFARSFSEALDHFRRRVEHCQFFDSWG